MKTFTALVIIASLFSADALTPSNTDRRAFLSKVATGSVVAVSTATVFTPPTVAADVYSLDGLDEVATKKEAPKKKSGDGGAIVGGAFAAGLALSLPFFAPNLARLAGIKNAKLPKK